MIIEDFVMLGRTVPELSKKHGNVVCSAGYSHEMRQFFRVYPLPPYLRLPRWSKCRMAVRRNVHDSRRESWRLTDGVDPVICGKTIKAHEFDFLKSLASESINELNDAKASLGIIIPQQLSGRFDGMKPSEEYLMSLFGEEDSPDMKRPRLIYRDGGGQHDQQLREWGSHEFIRKNRSSEHHKLWDALKLYDKSYEHLLFVGNHNQHRNSWLVIGIISERTLPQTDMFLDGT